MIKKIEEVNEDPTKPWFSVAGHGLPQNVEGRLYQGMNSLILFVLCEKMGYSTPVFMTFLQAKTQGVNILKGAKSFPIVYWDFSIKNSTGSKTTLEEYNSLSEEDKKGFSVVPFTRTYNVFNIDQTNYSEIFPEKWEELKRKFSVLELKDENGMFSCPVLDKMLKENAWLCPIVSSVGDHAFYRPSEDTIFIPLKGQFHTGENFYRTMLHEMAHSTGASTRCAREIRNSFGDPKYGKEELIAEFTAAVSCQSLGIVAGIQDYNAKYLKNWLNAIHEDPRFLYSVLSEVGKASTMILNTVEKLELQAQKNEEQTVIVMTEEEYLASKGYSFSGLGEPALHKGTQKTVRQQNKLLEKQAERNRRYTEKREEFRKEYKEKLAKGEIMKPTIIDQLISTAKGMPELESTQAARRSLEKRGISWAECKETIEAEKTERDSETKDFTLNSYQFDGLI